MCVEVDFMKIEKSSLTFEPTIFNALRLLLFVGKATSISVVTLA